MGRKRVYADAAARKRASRDRQRGESDIVTQTQGQMTGCHDIAPRAAPVRGADGPHGAVFQHQAAAGLLVRVDAELARGRVLATVLQPGQSGLQAGIAYPFRLDLMNEVHP